MNLDKYFDLFDRSRTSEEAMEELNGLFTDDMVFVLNGSRKQGLDQWKLFMKQVFTNNTDIKHMYEGWEKSKEPMHMKRGGPCAESLQMERCTRRQGRTLPVWTKRAGSAIWKTSRINRICSKAIKDDKAQLIP